MKCYLFKSTPEGMIFTSALNTQELKANGMLPPHAEPDWETEGDTWEECMQKYRDYMRDHMGFIDVPMD